MFQIICSFKEIKFCSRIDTGSRYVYSDLTSDTKAMTDLNVKIKGLSIAGNCNSFPDPTSIENIIIPRGNSKIIILFCLLNSVMDTVLSLH